MTASAVLTWFVEMRPKQAQKWMHRRSIGPVRFILIYGLALFGGLMAIWNSVLFYVLDRRFHAQMRQAGLSLPQLSPLEFLRHFVFPAGGICLAGGAVFGSLMWWLMEWQYKRYQRKSGAANA